MDVITKIHFLGASRTELVCLVVAKKLCRNMVSISISGLRATSGSGEHILEQLCPNAKSTGDLSEAGMEMNSSYVLTYKSRDRGQMEMTECAQLCHLSSP